MTTTTDLNITVRFQIDETYKEWKVDYSPLSDECIARDRTFKLLLALSELKNILVDFQNTNLFELMVRLRPYYIFQLWCNSGCHIEPYARHSMNSCLELKLHKAISPYGARNGET